MARARRLYPWLMLAIGKFMALSLNLRRARAPTKRTNSFAEKLLKAIKGEKGLVEPSYVYLPGVPGGEEIAKKTGCDFFAVPIELGVSWRPLPPKPL